MSDRSQWRVKQAILEAVENQLRENNPPEARQTLERRLAKGYSRQQAVTMIGSAIAAEIWYIGHEHDQYNVARYKAALKALG